MASKKTEKPTIANGTRGGKPSLKLVQGRIQTKPKSLKIKGGLHSSVIENLEETIEHVDLFHNSIKDYRQASIIVDGKSVTGEELHKVIVNDLKISMIILSMVDELRSKKGDYSS